MNEETIFLCVWNLFGLIYGSHVGWKKYIGFGLMWVSEFNIAVIVGLHFVVSVSST